MAGLIASLRNILQLIASFFVLMLKYWRRNGGKDAKRTALDKNFIIWKLHACETNETKEIYNAQSNMQSKWNSGK